ncbi:hypothetical protein DO73_6463 [Burkholderia pseudomallei]|nr:hypothetical protein DO73_6463 [Burkholderia pseudomallei]
MRLNRLQQSVGQFAGFVERGVVDRRDALADLFFQVFYLRERGDFLAGGLLFRNGIQFGNTRSTLVQTLVLRDLAALQVHRREQVRCGPVCEDRADCAENCLVSLDALLFQRRQQRLLQPFVRRRFVLLCIEQRAIRERLHVAVLIVFDFLRIQQAELHQLARGAYRRSPFDQILIARHQCVTCCAALHLLNDRLHLIEECVLRQRLGGNAAALDELHPLVAPDAAAGRRNHFLHPVRLVTKRRLVFRAVAQLDHLEHVHELAFVFLPMPGAVHGLVREFHLRQDRRGHLRVMLVGEDRHRVAHHGQIVGVARTVHLHATGELLRVPRRLLAQAESLNARDFVLRLLSFVQRAAQTAENACAGGLRRVTANRHAAGDTL